MAAFAPLLQTERLNLRPLQSADTPAMFAILGDPLAMAHWDTPPLARLGLAAEIVADQIAAMADGDYLYLTVWRGADAIGSVDLSAINATHRRADTGFLFRRDCWGQGYAHEAMTALIAHGFGTLQLARIGAHIQSRNLRAAHLLDGLGFAREGLLTGYMSRDGARHDSAIYGLVKP